MPQIAILALEDGKVFFGKSIGSIGHTVGEVVFNTAMTGYQEILTDPSYCQQIVALTYPHIGNTGIIMLDIQPATILFLKCLVTSVLVTTLKVKLFDSAGIF